MNKYRFMLATAVVFSCICAWAQTLDTVGLRRSFERPPDEARIMMRWWWFGPAVTKAQLEREMRLMKQGGIGGFEIQPVYPLALDGAVPGFRNFRYLSDEFLDALRFTSEKARELGLRVDLTLGSGWPYGGPQVPVTQAAARLRHERVRIDGNSRHVPVPYSGGGEKLLAVFAADRDLTQSVSDGILGLPPGLDGPQDISFFFLSRTGQQVKRAAVGAEGFVLDHYSRAALDNYLANIGGPLMHAFGSSPPHAIFCDSLEVYGADWTDDFPGEFRKRRGYDITPHLPLLASGKTPEAAAAVRHDWGRTLTELLEERFFAPMLDWSRRHKTLFRVQGYGTPPATLSMNALAGLPEGEGVQWKRISATRWASSAGHLYGRPVIHSETWTWLHSPVFRATPLDIKAEADLHFLQGITQLIGHGWPYTPEGMEYPGWRFYAAAVFNEKNPWWIVMPDVALYLQRVSFLLRQGKPANDIAYYLPTSDAWAHFSLGRTNLFDTIRERLGEDALASILGAGYNLDYLDDVAIEKIGRIENNTLALGENRYRIVVLPGVETIPPETLRKFEQFARAGGILVATRRLPAAAPGLKATDAQHREVRETAQRLFEGPSASALFLPQEGEFGARVAQRFQPDVALSPPAPDVGFVHRSTGAAEIYFLANTGNQRRSVTATFRVGGLGAELWNPVTGVVTRATVVSQSATPERYAPAVAGSTTLALDLEPYESRVIVFSKDSSFASPHAATTTSTRLDLSTGWTVQFGDHGQPHVMEKLRSWTEDEQTRFYSGTATYEKDIVVPDDFRREGLRVRLELGEGIPVARTTGMGYQALLDGPVREAAVVYVNGRRAGAVWCPPYGVEVTDLLRRGNNNFRVVVGNLAVNYMAGRALPDYRLLNLRYGERFQPQDMDKIQPVPAGLLGPIRLVAGANH